MLDGSSPLVRGQPNHLSCFIFLFRIIPARAGPTINIIITSHFHSGSSPLVRGQLRVYYRNLYCYPDHPRSCGANALITICTCSESGSSPLVRGQRGRTGGTQLHLRIIPARAGPTVRFALGQTVSKDHPRSCGANSRVIVYHTNISGSSPLVRGQQNQMTDYGRTYRIIPARAGPTATVYGRRTT